MRRLIITSALWPRNFPLVNTARASGLMHATQSKLGVDSESAFLSSGFRHVRLSQYDLSIPSIWTLASVSLQRMIVPVRKKTQSLTFAAKRPKACLVCH